MDNITPSVDVSHLAAFDLDGALGEAADRINHGTRKSFLRNAGILGGGMALLSLLPGVARAAGGGLPKGDIDILNYALTLEYLESSFYAEANRQGALSGELARFAKAVGQHEDAHVQALKQTLGGKATKKPRFDFQGTTAGKDTFAKTAMVLEDTGVKAYQGQATNIRTPAVLKAAISIHPVEARHAAWIASIMGSGSSPAPDAFNPAADMETVLAAVKSTGFVPALASAPAGDAVSGQPAMTG
ncbi:MAG TPA: ferritin-like domain-containing protein [Baekduia sp.]|nr:ferritin-like domain-containing protein [Baekduia sp.]